ncbi:MAG: aromatic ring-hydroxylating dioxygenase subunit alpha, partial [Myxococcales bacterium]|nr:aromatic ring-hydroxylating dioxygenase subunit alpha [Myxococcales bacterium]
GVVWIFPGDPDAARDVPLPAIPQLDGAERWDICPIVMTLRAHHSMIVENVCDFNHETLHEGKSPFLGQKFMGHERDGDTIYVRYETRIGRSGWVSRFAGGERSGRITLWYHYPYQGSNTDDKYVHWLYNRPIDAHTTECFFLFLFKEFTLPGTERALPAFLRAPLLKLAERTYIRPVLDQDRWALEEEQRAFERCGDVPSPEPNPIVPAFRRLTVEKWDAYRNRAAAAEGRA